MVEIDVQELMTEKTGDRGRIYLGTDLAEKKVTVGIVEVQDLDAEEEAESGD